MANRYTVNCRWPERNDDGQPAANDDHNLSIEADSAEEAIAQAKQQMDEECGSDVASQFEYQISNPEGEDSEQPVS